MSPAPPVGPTAAVVLAAGASTRLGTPKQLLELDGRPLVRRAVDAAGAAGCDPVVAVLGAGAPAIEAALRGSGARCVVNTDWAQGMAGSIRCGIAALPEEADAVVILPCDQPAVSAGLLVRLRAAQRESGKPMAACAYAGTLGPPALFVRACFPALRSLQGDAGARSLLASARDDVATIDFPEGALDVDTPEDWRVARARAAPAG